MVLRKFHRMRHRLAKHAAREHGLKYGDRAGVLRPLGWLSTQGSPDACWAGAQERTELMSVRASGVYRPLVDRIILLPPPFMPEGDSPLGTLMHELIHSTGHATRLRRPVIVRMGLGLTYSGRYSEMLREELVAELGGAALLELFGGEPEHIRDAVIERRIQELYILGDFGLRGVAVAASAAIEVILGGGENAARAAFLAADFIGSVQRLWLT